MARMCIITRKEVPKGKGTPIRDDAVIRAIRAIKGKLGMLQNNELVVSDEGIEEYKKKRSNFERMAVIHTTIAAIMVLVFVFGPLLMGAPFNPVGILVAIAFGVMFALLALLSYIPSIDNGKPMEVPTPGQIVERLLPFGKAKNAPSPTASVAASPPASASLAPKPNSAPSKYTRKKPKASSGKRK